MNDYLVEIRNLVHTYPTGMTALKGVNARIRKGEMLSIIGQNGSGKTTLVRHLNGLLRPTSGEVLIEGEDISTKSIGELSRKVGYVFQNPNHQIFCTSVKDELEVAPKNFHWSKEQTDQEIQRVVELMDLHSVLDKNPLMLDYTTKKIVTIASVLVFHPEILILDEPTGGLDEAGRRMLSQITSLMQEQGHTVIMISHDMDYVAEHTQRIIVMAQGEVTAEGTPKEIFAKTDILKRAQIEPPQITQLDAGLRTDAGELVLSVEEFVAHYSNCLGQEDMYGNENKQHR